MDGLPSWDQVLTWSDQTWAALQGWLWRFHKTTELGLWVALGSLVFILVVLNI